MGKLRSKSVYDQIKKDDGIRILATRFRGRGMRSNRYHVWMPSLGPSEGLLRSFQSEKINWAEFKKHYKNEILSSETIDKKNKTIRNHGQKFTLRLIQSLLKKQNVTIMCHCNTDEKYCHIRVLEKLIMKV